jgi:hypothetical protein
MGFSRLAPSLIARKPARDCASLQALTCLWSPSGRPRSLRVNLFTEVSRRSRSGRRFITRTYSFTVFANENSVIRSVMNHNYPLILSKNHYRFLNNQSNLLPLQELHRVSFKTLVVINRDNYRSSIGKFPLKHV